MVQSIIQKTNEGCSPDVVCMRLEERLVKGNLRHDAVFYLKSYLEGYPSSLP